MKIYSWNVNGIRAVQKKGLLEPFFAEHDPDIFCIQETKANHDQIDFDWPQYEEYWCSAEKKGYSGTAIFTKHSPDEIINGLPEDIVDKYQLEDKYGNTAKEGRVITAEFKPFYVSCVYTPNAKDDLSRIPLRQKWDPVYLEFMNRLRKKKPVIFCGDFNVAHQAIDLARPKANEGKKGFTKEEREGFDAFVSSNFVDTLRYFKPDVPDLYTWWSHWGAARERNVGWRIDYIMVTDDLLPILKNAKIHPATKGSDHCPTSVELSLNL